MCASSVVRTGLHCGCVGLHAQLDAAVSSALGHRPANAGLAAAAGPNSRARTHEPELCRLLQHCSLSCLSRLRLASCACLVVSLVALGGPLGGAWLSAVRMSKQCSSCMLQGCLRHSAVLELTRLALASAAPGTCCCCAACSHRVSCRPSCARWHAPNSSARNEQQLHR
jgi:hypothetical protein